MQKSPSKAQLKANCFNFGVSSGDATQILSCLILVLPLVFGRGGYGEKQSSTKGEAQIFGFIEESGPIEVIISGCWSKP